MNTIAQGFAEYERDVMPADAGLSQRVETKRAFYAGCWLMMSYIEAAIDTTGDDDAGHEAFVQYMDALAQEMSQFSALVKAGGDTLPYAVAGRVLS